jgi:gluconate 2-dehydrogenase alpha chain
MATKLKEVDVVLVGLGWTGGILAKELSEAGLKVVALERGGMRDPAVDFSVPLIRDELRFSSRSELVMNPARDTLTIRNNPSQKALPMRRVGSFLPGEGLGGSGVHWNGVTWRWTDMELKIRSLYEERYGKNFIPADMTIQDWGISYAELEPYYEKFEYTAGVSGKGGQSRRQDPAGGQPVRSAAGTRISAAAARAESRLQSFPQGSHRQGVSPIPAADGECVARVYQSRWLEARAVPVLRILRALRLRGECERQSAQHRDPDRDGQSQFRGADAFMGNEGPEGFDRKARHRGDLHQRAER